MKDLRMLIGVSVETSVALAFPDSTKSASNWPELL